MEQVVHSIVVDILYKLQRYLINQCIISNSIGAYLPKYLSRYFK